MRAGRSILAVAGLLVLGVLGVSADTYPRIQDATLKDALFRQLQADISDYHRRAADNVPISGPSFYSIIPTDFETLYALSARINNGLYTIATLNRIANPGTYRPDRELILSNIPGIFIPVDPKTSLEQILYQVHAAELSDASRIVIRGDATETFYFLPGAQFTSIDFAYFLGIFFRLPLPVGIVTSRFGTRDDPFTGATGFHNGIDIAAPLGTDVYAVREGVVVEQARNDILGIYCVIEHVAGYQTVYGHLSKCNVVLNQEIASGTIIGAVGTTGRSTGPHLHFEVREKNEPTNPEAFLPTLEHYETHDD